MHCPRKSNVTRVESEEVKKINRLFYAIIATDCVAFCIRVLDTNNYLWNPFWIARIPRNDS